MLDEASLSKNVRNNGVVTIASVNYLPYVRALHYSLKSSGNRCLFLACILDRPTDGALVAEEYSVVYADELGFDDFEKIAFQYNPFELSCAVRPKLFSFLLREYNVQKWLMLDSDMQVYTSLSTVWDALESSSIYITPHISKPLPFDGCSPNDHFILKSGIYNGGMFGFVGGDDVHTLFSWWHRSMSNSCIIDIAANYNVDQRWLDFLPAFQPHLHIERSAGVNVAYWNLPQRQIEYDVDRLWRVNGEPLVTFHFSGFAPSNPQRLSHFNERIDIDRQPAVKKLMGDYAALLHQQGYTRYGHRDYGYARLSDGTLIKNTWREAVRTKSQSIADVADYFDVRKTPDLVSRLDRGARSTTPRASVKVSRYDRLVEQVHVLEAECAYWRERSERLARMLPVRCALYLRRLFLKWFKRGKS